MSTDVLTVDLNDAVLVPKTNHTSKGDQPKWQVGDRWYKADHMGYEALAEVVISSLLKKSNVTDFVDYALAAITYRDKTLCGCVSRNFRGEDEELIPVERLHRLYYGVGLAQTLAQTHTVEERILYTVDFVEKITKMTNFRQYLVMMLELDQLFLNEDRHTNNIAVIRNKKTGEFRLCPIFDNGLSLLSDINDYGMKRDIYHCIERVQAKPFASNFDEQVEAANSIFGSFLKCSFSRSDVSASLDGLSTLYRPETLQRVESIIFEQMRRYPIYF